MHTSPPICPGNNIAFVFLYNAKKCEPSFGVRVKWEGGWSKENACEHIAEECGRELLPKAYVIPTYPWVPGDKMRLDDWGRVRTQT